MKNVFITTITVLFVLFMLLIIYSLGYNQGQMECSRAQIERSDIGLRYIEVYPEPYNLNEKSKFEYIIYGRGDIKSIK